MACRREECECGLGADHHATDARTVTQNWSPPPRCDESRSAGDERQRQTLPTAEHLDRRPRRADSACVRPCRLSLPLLFGIATAFGISSSIQSYLLSAAAGEPIAGMATHLLILNLVYWYVPALLAPAIMRVATRYQFGRGLVW